jgi:N-acetyl-anhydromuramyl-L-alanine amidase AmpD
MSVKGPGGEYILPRVVYRETPNQSARPNGRADIFGIVVHDTEGGYQGAIQTLCTPRGKESASAHGVLREDGGEFTQLVAFERKAWHAVAANQHFLGLEMAGFLNREGTDQWHVAARICAYWCHHFRIPPVWNVRHGGAFAPGITRHKDLGLAGGGHIDPTTDDAKWIWFVLLVQREVARGGFLPVWGRDRAW